MKCCSCSKGCELHILREDKLNILISGGACHRGEAYALQQIELEKKHDAAGLYKGHIQVKNGYASYLMVSSVEEIPIDDFSKMDSELEALILEAPIKNGQVIFESNEMPGIKIIATRSIRRRAVKV